ncbi:PfkB family carbohydrate kinase [bacterium]|nr:PfkB family carbohydrate kinase [bacterium]
MKPTQELSALLAAAKSKRVLVIGDLYLDVYVSGELLGLSPEAPVPVVESRSRKVAPGVACNVAAGIAALGATAQIVGVVGDDADAETLKALCRQLGVDTDGVVVQAGRATNQHTRITVRDAHMPERPVLRIDSPRSPAPAAETEAAVIARIQALAPTVDAIVVIESVGGIATSAVIDAAQRAARAHDILLVGDLFGQAQFAYGYDLLLPNEREAGNLVGVRPDTDSAIDDAGNRLVTEYNNNAVAVTRGPKGITLYLRQGRIHVPTQEREVFDVTGAGDTVTAAFTVALLAGADHHRAAQLANLAAYVAVGRSGTAIVTADDVQHAEVEISSVQKGGKLRSREELARIVQAAKAQGKKIAFTNGCFDLIHPGHVTYLRQAAELGDALIVALNSDSSVQSLKGPTRPILKQDERAMILSALESVTWITIFDEQRVTGLLEELKPDVWVKGGDYTLDSLDQGERRMADSLGCQIALIPPIEGVSTTDIVHRIAEARGGTQSL